MKSSMDAASHWPALLKAITSFFLLIIKNGGGLPRPVLDRRRCMEAERAHQGTYDLPALSQTKDGAAQRSHSRFHFSPKTSKAPSRRISLNTRCGEPSVVSVAVAPAPPFRA